MIGAQPRIAEVVIVDGTEQREICFDLRKRIFVEEQFVPIDLELDHYDDEAVHYLLTLDGTPVGTARLIDKNGIAKIGRVAIIKEERGHGLGRLLMQFVIHDARQRGFHESMLDAQTYAVPFYEGLGYVTSGDVFDDAGMPHLHMHAVLAPMLS
jgi:predicted GNAT family N-acyltransferase